MDGLVSGGNEAVESLLGLLDTFLGKCPHVAGNFEMLGGSHDFLLLWRRIGCYRYETGMRSYDLVEFSTRQAAIGSSLQGASAVKPASSQRTL
jgi:hypothetical protein